MALAWQVEIVEVWAEPETPDVGQSTKLNATVRSLVGETISALVIFRVEDATGRAVFVDDVSASITVGGVTVNTWWTPEEGGTHTLKVLVWKSWEEPISLAESKSITIMVGRVDIRIEKVELKPARVKSGENVIAEVTVANRGDVRGAVEVRITINGEEIATKYVWLDPHEEVIVRAGFTAPTEPGTYQVCAEIAY